MFEGEIGRNRESETLQSRARQRTLDQGDAMKRRDSACSRTVVQLWAAGALWLLAAACTGQSGAEGTSDDPKSPGYAIPGWPGPGASCAEGPVDELPFTPASIEEVANGKHETTFRWSEPGLGLSSSDDHAMPLTIEVSQHSESRTSKECGGVSGYEADVTVTLGGKTASFRGGVQGTKRGAFVAAYASTAARNMLDIPGSELTGVDHPKYRVIAQFDGDGMRGGLAFTSGSTGECGVAAWPAARTCAFWEQEQAPDKRFGDAELADQLSVFGSRKYALEWADGSSTELELHVESADAPICVGTYLPDRLEDGTQPQRLTQRITLRARSSDGRLDVQVPANATMLWSAERGLIASPSEDFAAKSTIQLSARAVGRFGSEPKSEQLFDILELAAGFSAEAASGTVSVGSVRLSTPPPSLEAGDPKPQALENGECWGIGAGEGTPLSGTFED